MNKNTKMILGVGALAIVGYLVYKQMNKTATSTASFANVSGRIAGGGYLSDTSSSAMRCCGHKSKVANAESPSGFTFSCCNGQAAPYSNGNPCDKCPSGKTTASGTLTSATGFGF